MPMTSHSVDDLNERGCYLQRFFFVVVFLVVIVRIFVIPIRVVGIADWRLRDVVLCEHTKEL